MAAVLAAVGAVMCSSAPVLDCGYLANINDRPALDSTCACCNIGLLPVPDMMCQMTSGHSTHVMVSDLAQQVVGFQ